MQLALIGDGKMSQAIRRLAGARGHMVTTVIVRAENPGATALTAERLEGAEVVVEFTSPTAAVDNLLALARLGCTVVSGTTGWADRRAEVEAGFRERGALLHSPNFALGVQLFLRAARDLARTMAGRPEFAELVVETHHAAKRDAPSGTGLALREALRHGDPGRDFAINSVRGGHVPGTHDVSFDAPFESILLRHTARSREVFAAGALAAAEWLRGKRGVFTLDQMLFGEGP